MKIYSMTATFGKLEHEVLTLKPGLNIIEAPNEWGKSTWCAFLVAMLYGIETRVHTTKAAIADKERYAPWSGSPMAGRIDLNWEGKDITIERSSKGRGVFNVFRAYETESGLAVSELTAANCGQLLLGVEKTVFTRSGFIRLSDMPVTQDEALRRRLNAIVTTGDDSGTADALAQTLRDLKNRCRLNRSTGLLPQAEAQQRQLQDDITQLRQLQTQSADIQQRLQQLEQHHKLLLNHQTALGYAANRTYAEKLAAAETAKAAAAAKVQQLEAVCVSLPEGESIDRTLLQLRQLRDRRDSLHMDMQMLPPAPQMPEVNPVFRGVEPETAIAQAKLSQEIYAEDSRKKPFPWYCILSILLGLAALLIPHWVGSVLCGIGLLAGILLLCSHLADSRRRENTSRALRYQYQPIPPEQWVSAAEEYAAAQAAYHRQTEAHRDERKQLEERMEALNKELEALTGGRSLPECEQVCLAAQESRNELRGAMQDLHRCEELVQALHASHKEAPAPAFPDTMTYSEAETTRLLSDCLYEQRQLQQKLGHCQGQMATFGSEEALQQKLDSITGRIDALEQTYSALELAQNTLTRARAELQRRFAPRISSRAQELFGKLTDGRYTRLTLGEDLTVNAATQEEDTLHSALWRSEGTVDQLYLALRLAVAEELTPDTPLVLDDALVRFDDRRLAEALDVLAEAAESRQVILFSCQSREAKLIADQKG